MLNFDLRAAGDLWALFVYMILPVVTSAGIAHLLGGWVWRRTHVDERDREPAPAF
ncbi:MAG TPA: hypothetical protein VMY34_08665 [Acidimicrobiales bacterium]|nr:hypothetical protein [Acidimicrobiales bacterium]